jgi:hypothetical protein
VDDHFSRLPRARQVLAPFALFAVLAAGFLWQPLATGQAFLPTDLAFRYDFAWMAQGQEPGRTVAQNPLLADVSDYYHPYRAFALREIEAGRLPLWNPWILAGTPFLASGQAALLDPVNVLTLPLGLLSSWTFGAWLRLALLGAFTYGFARTLGRSPVAAGAAGIVFMLCGFVAVWLNYNVVTSLVWMPALFWAGTRLVETGRRRALAATALAVGALLLGGHPETQFLVGIAWAAWCAHALAGLPAPRATLVGRRGGALAAAVGLGLALSAVQWLPLLDFLLRSHAFDARAESGVAFDALETLLRFAVLVLPNLGGTRVDVDYWLPRADYLNFNERAGYIGLLALALAVLGFLAARRRPGADARHVRFLAWASLAAVAIGVRAPGFHWVKALPLLDVGHGVRWFIVSSFFGALLAARGVDALRESAPGAGETRRFGRACLWTGAAGLAALCLAWGVLTLSGERLLALRSPGGETPVSMDVLRELLHPARLTVSPPLLFLVAGGGVFLAVARDVVAARTGALALCALLYLDLWTFGSRYNPVTPAREIFPANPTTRFLAEQLGRERFVGGGDMLRPNVAMLFGFRDLRGYEDLVDRDFAGLYGPTLRRLGAKVWGGDPRLERHDLRLLDLASVRFLLSALPPRGPSPFPYPRVFSSPGVHVFENPGALPRAYTVLAARVAPDAEGARAAVLARDFDPAREVILVGGGAALAGVRAEPPPVVWRADEAGTVVVEATLPAPGYLVLTDRWSPDWQASVDGEPAPCLRANGIFRAVALPAGTHEVRFRYAPRLLAACAGVSLAAAAVLAALLAAPGSRSARSDPGGSGA